nr:TonB-dependent receptor [Pedobacter sp. ASV19]
MKRKLLNVLMLWLAFSSLNSYAQQNGTIKGKVLTSEGRPAQNISVQLQGKKIGTSTDNKGEFTIGKVKPGDYILKVSAIGLNPIQKMINIHDGQQLELNFTLSENYAELQEVIIGGGKVNKFSRPSSNTVAKVQLKDLENPQVYTSVSKELIQDQMIVTYSDVLKNVPGVILQLQNNGNGPGGTVAMRGFSGGSYLRNGVPGMTVGYLDPVNLESLEAIKGPSGALFGSSSLTSFGGLFNRITKKPLDIFEASAGYSAGSFGLSRITFDVNAPLNNDKNLLFRISGAKHYEGSFQDAGFQSYVFVAPSLTYKVNDRLSIFLDGEYMKGKNNGFYRLFVDASNATGVHTPADLNFDFKRRFVGDDMESNVTTGNFYAQADYELGRGWKSQTNFSYSSTDGDGASAYLSMAAGNKLLTRNATLSLYSKNAMTDLQQNFTGNFKIGDIGNKLLIGLDYLHNEARSNSASVAFDQIDAINPGANYGKLNKPALIDRLSNSPFTRTSNFQNTYSVYTQDVIDLTNQLSALASIRLDRFENNGTFNLNTGVNNGQYKQTSFSPKFGLVYQPIKDKLSVFANYMNGFQNVAPVTQPDQSISNFKARQANQTEGGLKLNLLDGKLTSTLSYYYIKVNNTVRQDPDRPGFSIQNGNQLSKGFEAEAAFNPIPGFNLVAGYAYNDSKYLQASANVDGLRPESAGPQTMINAWASYRFTEGQLQGFGLGFGGNYASKNITAITTTSLFTLPAYTALNASAFYDQPRFRVGLKANNLNNEKYYIGWGTTIPQMPANFIAEFTLKLGGVK